MGRYVMCDILLSNHIGVGLSKWTVYEAASGRLAYYLWFFCDISTGIDISYVPKLSQYHGNYLLV